MALFAFLVTSRARAAPPLAPAPEGVLVSVGPRCSAWLTKVSYDDPGADDAELLELHVERVVAGSGTDAADAAPRGAHAASPAAGCLDATTVVDAGRPAPSDGAAGAAPLALGDCNLGALDLISGGGGACETYRTLPLALVPVPDDGYVTFCAADSKLAGAHCDVTMAGRAALKNGWLQNGPSDGLRILDASGTPALEVGYEGSLACFGPAARQLVPETGQLAQAAPDTDDVNVFCGDAFVLLSPSDAPLRGRARCPLPVTAGDASLRGVSANDGGSQNARVATDSGSAGSGWTGERAPAAPPKSSSGFGSIDVDAGLVPITRTPAPPPSPPGCTTARTVGRISTSMSRGGSGFAGAWALALLLTRRTRRPGRPSRPRPR